MDAERDVDLDELGEWSRNLPLGLHGEIRPRDLQTKYRIGFNAACRALEALEARGDLQRVEGAMAWRPAQAFVGVDPGKGKDWTVYFLQLSAKEHGALLEGLGELLATPRFACPADQEHDHEKVKRWRAIRSRMKRPG